MKKIFLIVLIIIFMALDYGAAVSQKGYDVKTCADRFLVYSSAFQTLKVFNTYSVSTIIPAGDPNIITIQHNIGYFVPFIIIYNGSSRSGTTNSYFFSDSYGQPLGGSYYVGANNRVNDLKIYIDAGWDGANASGGHSQVGDTVYFTVYLFLNNFSTISHSEKNTSTSSGASSADYGIRVSKSGYDVKTCTNEQCILSSSFFNQIIDQQGIFTSSDGGSPQVINITSQGFIPSVLSYYYEDGCNEISFKTTYVKADKLSLGMNAGDKLYYIIFKQALN